MTNLIPEQAFIKLANPILKGNKEFNARVELYRNIDHILTSSGLESAVKYLMVKLEVEDLGCPMDTLDQLRFQMRVSRSLRTNIARALSGRSFNDFSIELADSFTLQSFCGYDHPSIKKVPCKSHLHSLSKFIPSDIINKSIDCLSKFLSKKSKDIDVEFDMSSIFVDSTCLELNIHHPVDWILLKDAVITIMKSIKCIRKHGLKHRMTPPEGFMKKVNNIAMAITMTKSVRKAESKKTRKNLFRDLKSHLRVCEAHGHRYLKILQRDWTKTDLSKKQAEKISKRMLNVLDQVDVIIHQAHERIIGERQVRNKGKILSLYEKHAQVYKRGKAGADVEFGVQLFIAETEDGLIVNWDVHDDVPWHDSKFMKPCIEELSQNGLKPKMISGDRGFSAKKISDYLSTNKIEDNICPKDRERLARKLKSKKFRAAANRRSQTEGRIGILKNKFLGGHLTTKGFEQQKVQVAWAILTHNLWVAARKMNTREDPPLAMAS